MPKTTWCRLGLHRWATVVYRGTTYGRCMDCAKWDEILDTPPEELTAVMDHQIRIDEKEKIKWFSSAS